MPGGVHNLVRRPVSRRFYPGSSRAAITSEHAGFRRVSMVVGKVVAYRARGPGTDMETIVEGRRVRLRRVSAVGASGDAPRVDLHLPYVSQTEAVLYDCVLQGPFYMNEFTDGDYDMTELFRLGLVFVANGLEYELDRVFLEGEMINSRSFLSWPLKKDNFLRGLASHLPRDVSC